MNSNYLDGSYIPQEVREDDALQAYGPYGRHKTPHLDSRCPCLECEAGRRLREDA